MVYLYSSKSTIITAIYRIIDHKALVPNVKIQIVNSMKYRVRKIKETLGINFKYHYLRHTYGTRLAKQNTPAHLLCNQMGHASSKVTEKYYLAVSKQGEEIIKVKLENI